MFNDFWWILNLPRLICFIAFVDAPVIFQLIDDYKPGLLISFFFPVLHYVSGTIRNIILETGLPGSILWCDSRTWVLLVVFQTWPPGYKGDHLVTRSTFQCRYLLLYHARKGPYRSKRYIYNCCFLLIQVTQFHCGKVSGIYRHHI